MRRSSSAATTRSRRCLEHLDATLGRGRCVAVIGASGSGKSSLVRAGRAAASGAAGRALGRAPAVDARASGRSPRWRARWRARCGRPGTTSTASRCSERIEHEPVGLVEMLRDVAAGGDGRQRSVLVVVDQAEELVVHADARRARALRGAPAGARRDPACRCGCWRRCARSSSAHRCATHELVELIQDTVLVGPLDRSRLPEVIVGPARKAGLEFSPGLVERMVEDTRGGDALPLLAYTLRELYDRERPDPHVITGADYDAIGGVEGALRRRADLVARGPRPSAASRELVLPTLLRLVTVDAEGEPARRRRRRARRWTPRELEVVRAFVDARLLVSAHGRRRTTRSSRSRTRRCCAPGRRCARRSRPRGSACNSRPSSHATPSEWDEQHRPDSYLLRGERLARARRLLASPAGRPRATSTAASASSLRPARTWSAASAPPSTVAAAATIAGLSARPGRHQRRGARDACGNTSRLATRPGGPSESHRLATHALADSRPRSRSRRRCSASRPTGSSRPSRPATRS